MKTLLIILLMPASMIVPTKLFSQKHMGSIKGRVVFEHGDPAQGVTIFLKRSGKMTLTNNKGEFSIERIPSGSDSLIISSIGVVEFGQIVDIPSGQSLKVETIHLTRNVTQLQTVEINGRSSKSYKSDYSFFGSKTESALKDIPQSISTITKELTHDKMEFTLKDAVTDVAGVNQYSGYDEYTIRGFRAENARDINGLRGYNSTYTSNMLVNIERVEVIKGPTASLYGNCDPGGTINLVTKKPLDHSDAEFNLYGGSWNHFRAEGDITGPLNKSKSLLYRMNAGYDQQNSFRDQIHSKSYQLAPSFTFVPSDKIKINLDFSVSHINTVLDRGQPGINGSSVLNATPITISLVQPGNFLKETDLATTLSFTWKISKRLSFNTGYLNYHTNQDVAQHAFNNYASPDSVYLLYSTWKYKTVTNTVSNYFTYQANTGKITHKLLLGYDYIKTKVTLDQQYYENPGEFGTGSGIVGTFSLLHPVYNQAPPNTYQLSDFDNNATNVNADVYHTQGIYVQDELSFGRWKVLAGIREEFYKGDDTDSAGMLSENVFLPRLGIVYAIRPNLNAYITYNKGFDPFEASTELQQFDQPFKPLISQLYELGLKGNFLQNRLGITFSLYQLTVDNVATNAGDPSNPNLFVQQGQNRSRGSEIEVTGNILPNLSVLISYAYNQAVITKDDDKTLIGTTVANAPKNAGSSWIKYTFSKSAMKGLGISIGHAYIGSRTTLDPNTNLPSYFILNGGLTYGFKKFTVGLIVNNITNATYWRGAYDNINKWPGSPRNFMFNLGFRF